jgi:hypothetical protein
MRRKETTMLTLAEARRAIDHFLQGQPADGALAFNTPVQFDPGLLPRLLAAHDALNARFAALMCLVDRDADGLATAARDCVNQFHELRRAESIWLYPVLARAVEEDAPARARLMELRLATLTLARRTLRCFDELAQALQKDEPLQDAADRLSAALAEYLRRSETEIYPLYSVVGLRSPAAAERAA